MDLKLGSRNLKMKLFGIMLVKNEIDIIGYVLKEAERWCDKIFILDKILVSIMK